VEAAAAGDDDERCRWRWRDGSGVDGTFFAPFLWRFHSCFGAVLKVKWCYFGDKTDAIFGEKLCYFRYCLQNSAILSIVLLLFWVHFVGIKGTTWWLFLEVNGGCWWRKSYKSYLTKVPCF